MPRRHLLLPIAGAAMLLSACGGGHSAGAMTVTKIVSPTSVSASASVRPSDSTSVTSSSSSTSASSSATSEATDAWDPDGDVCDLLTPVAEQSMGLKMLTGGTSSVAGQCVVTFQTSSDGPTPKLSLNKIQDSVGGQISSLQAGIGDLSVQPAAGPTAGAKWAFATGSPDMQMLFWAGPDGATWKLETDSNNPQTRKVAMLDAARKINARLTK